MTGPQLDLGDGVIEFQGVQYVTIRCPEPGCDDWHYSAGHERIEHLPPFPNAQGGMVSNHKIVRDDQ